MRGSSSKTATARKPQPKPQQADRQATGKAKRDDEDPFDVDRAVLKRAIPLSRKPARGRMLRVVCPMCETPGFAPDNAAGKEVRCANPDCLVPVFTAPARQKQQQSAEQEKPRSALPLVLGSVLGLAAVAAVAFYMMRPEPEPRPPSVPPQVATTNGAGSKTNGTQKPPDVPAEGTSKKPETQPAEQAPGDEEILNGALLRLEKTVLERDRNRSPDFCRRLLAEALVEVGLFEKAQQHIAQFARLRPPHSSYAVLPIAWLGWARLARNDRSQAVKAADEAVRAAESLPQYGRFPIHATMQLAALLIAVDRSEEADEWLRRFHHSGPIARHAVFIEASESLRLYDVDRLAAHAPVFTWDAPQAVGVAIILAANGFVEPATVWLVGLRNAESRAEAFGELATALVYRGAGDAAIQQVVQRAIERGGGEAAFVAARLATTYRTVDKSRAAQSAQQAEKALSGVTVPPPFRLPDLVGIYRWKETDNGPLFVAAKAAAELARFHARNGQTATAWQWVQRGLALLRATAPSTVATDERDRELERGGIDAIAFRLRQALELESDSEARRAAIDYRANLRELQRRAELRRRLVATLLREAAEWGLLPQVLQELQRVSAADDVNDREAPTPVAFLGYRLSQLAETAEQKQLVTQLIGGRRLTPDVLWAAERKTASLAADAPVDELVAVLQRLAPDPSISEDDFREWKEVWMLRLACRLAAGRGAAEALRYVRGFSGQLVWQEEAYRTVAAFSALHGHAAEVWRFILEQDTVPPTGVAALCRGLIGGLTARR